MRIVRPVLVLLALVLASSAAHADTITQSEPIDVLRDVVVKLVTPAGATASGVSGTTIKIAQPGGNFVSANATDVTEITGGAESLYRFRLAVTETATQGQLLWQVSKSDGSIQVSTGTITIAPTTALQYGLAQGGASGSITLPTAASSTSNFYAGSGAGCVVRIVAGTGAGQARLCTAYTGSSRQLNISPAWVTTPDSTSVEQVLPITGQLDASVVTAIQTGLATSTAVAAIPTTPLLSADTRLNNIDTTISSRASSTAVSAIPTTTLLTSDTRLNDLDAAISSRATDAHVLAIPTTPLLSGDGRVAHLDADVSSRSSAAAVAAIPTTPLLTSDSRLNDLDAAISSRLAPTVPGRTLAIASTGQVGLNWADIASPSTTQNLSGTTVTGSGGGGDPTTIAAAVWAFVPDSGAPTGALSWQEQWNILLSVIAGNANGLDGVVGSTKSLDTTKHRAEFTVQAGVRTFTSRNGD